MVIIQFLSGLFIQMFLSESRPTVLTGCHDAARGIVQCNGIPQPNASNSRETLALTANIDVTYQGRPQDLGGGGAKKFFFQIWEFACRKATCCAWRSHAQC